MNLDRVSMLAEVTASATVADVERELVAERLTLGLVSVPATTVADWIASGAPGARSPWSDPADHLVAGYVATFEGRRIEIRPAPRRATGPDLFALVFGHGTRWAQLESAWLRVHHLNGRVPRTAPFHAQPPPWTDDEERLAKAIDAELSAGRPR